MDVTLPPISDDELCALALAADPDAPLPDDAVMLSEVLEPGTPQLLPEWYMPAPMGGAPPLRGWRRRVVLLVIVAFLTITAYGLCNTYGQFPHLGLGWVGLDGPAGPDGEERVAAGVVGRGAALGGDLAPST